MKLKSNALYAFIVFTTTLAVYLPSVKYDLVRIDDPEYILENRHIERGLTAETVKWAFTGIGYASNWHPLAWISHALDISLGRSLDMTGAGPEDNARAWIRYDSRSAGLMHAHNVLLHAFNATLLFLLIVLLTGYVKRDEADSGESVREESGSHGSLILDSSFPAAFAALIWAVHPLRCEVVCWVSERKELLCVFWMLLSLISWIKSGRGRNHLLFRVLSAVCFCLALISKPVAVTMPVIIFAFEWVLMKAPFRKSLTRVLPFGALSACVCAITMAAQTEALEYGKQIGWPLRIECALEAPVIYLRQTVFPAGLSPVYLRGTETDWPLAVSGALFLLAMLCVCGGWLLKRGKFAGIATFIAAWSYVGLIPMIGLVKVGGQAHSDRYTYWIGCGIAAGAALIAGMMMKKAVRCRKELLVVPSGVLAVLTVLTAERSSHWESTLSLYRDAVAKSHDAEIAFELSDELVRMKTPASLKEAEIMLRNTVSANPDSKAYAALAYFLAFHTQGQPMLTDPGAGAFQEARGMAQRALSTEPGCWIAHAALTACCAREKKWAEAARHGEKALASGPDDPGFAELVSDCRRKAEESCTEGGR